MKKIKVVATEPVITLEFSLTEVKNLTEIIGSFSAKEFKAKGGKVFGRDKDVTSMLGGFYCQFHKIIKEVEALTNPTEGV